MDIRAISSHLQENAKSELNEVPERIAEDVEKIRKWLLEQPHLTCRKDDQWLLAFLRGCKFSIERTKEKLDSYYTIRYLLPELFKNRDPLGSAVQEILKAGLMLPLPKPIDNGGPRIILYRCRNIFNIPVDNLAKAFYMLLDILMMEDDSFAISGGWFWFDLASFPLSYIFQITPYIMKKNLVSLKKGYPVRVSSVNVINGPSAIEQIFDLLSAPVSFKLKEKITMYSESNIKIFNKFFPQKYMPVEYGGENGSVDELREYWKKKFEDYREWFLEDENYGTNEKLRPVKPKTSADLFGVEDSFRKLTVD